VFVPAIDFMMGMKFGYNNYKDYFENGQPWLLAADAVFLTPGWEESKGTAAEIVTADKNDIPVFDNLKDMNKYFKEGTNEKNTK